MKKAYVFPGQGSQFPGMGKDLYEENLLAKTQFEQANELLGYRITDVMFEGSAEDLKATKITQPAIFLHSVVAANVRAATFQPDMVAGHSLGEFSALVAADAMSFEDGLKLVQERALAMQEACDLNPSTMAAVLGLDDETIDQVCEQVADVVPANYNCPGQVVISGSESAIDEVAELLKDAGAKRVLKLPVAGAFHSPFMEPAQRRLSTALEQVTINEPKWAVYQNVIATASTNPETIKALLNDQLTAPVKWTQSVQQMIADGATEFIEVGPGSILQGLIRKINREVGTIQL